MGPFICELKPERLADANLHLGHAGNVGLPEKR